jgi:hypothetical protein
MSASRILDAVAGLREGDGRQRERVFVPPPFAADSIMEAADAGVALIVLHHRRHSGAGHDPGEEVEGDESIRS